MANFFEILLLVCIKEVLIFEVASNAVFEGSLVSTIFDVDAEVVLVSIGDVDIEAVIFVVEKVVGSVKLVA
jgi:hypothetical protein